MLIWERCACGSQAGPPQSHQSFAQPCGDRAIRLGEINTDVQPANTSTLSPCDVLPCSNEQMSTAVSYLEKGRLPCFLASGHRNGYTNYGDANEVKNKIIIMLPGHYKQLSYRRETARRTSYFDLQNCEVKVLSHPFGRLGGNVDALCVHCWKKRGRLPIGDNWTL